MKQTKFIAERILALQDLILFHEKEIKRCEKIQRSYKSLNQEGTKR